jgi:hypothetical protein
MIRRRDTHCADVGGRQQVAKILVDFGLRGHLGGGLEVGLVDVAQRRHHAVGQLLAGAEVPLPHPPQADESDADALVGPGETAGEKRSCQRGPEKTAALDGHEVLPFFLKSSNCTRGAPAGSAVTAS